MRIQVMGVVSAVALAGCGAFGGGNDSPSRSQRQAQTETQNPWVASRAQGGSESEQALARAATGAQAGTVQEIRDGELVLDPYESSAGVARLALDEETALFKEGERLPVQVEDELKPGTPVNVYLDTREQGRPKVMGIAILSGERARQMREAFPTAPAPQQLQEMARNAEFQVGRIEAVSGDELRLDPYQGGAGEARLEMSGEVPVFRGTERIGREQLQPGSDVRVYFESGRGANPRVIAVQVLSEEEARRARQGR